MLDSNPPCSFLDVSQYSSVKEENAKYEQFKKSLLIVDQYNAEEQRNGGSAVFGITVFSDMTTDAFKSRYLGMEATDEVDEVNKGRNLEEWVPGIKSNHTSSNWIGVLTTPVKNQGNCGSCW